MTAMAELSVAVKTPLRTPPMMITAVTRPGRASRAARRMARMPGKRSGA